MLDKNVFMRHIRRLEIEYAKDNFTMSKARCDQWYEFMKDFDEQVFGKAVDWVLMNCRNAPSMADVMKGYKESYDGYRKA